MSNMSNTSVSNLEIVQVAEAVAREKGIPRHNVITAIEQAVQVASRKKYGQESDITVKINQTTGEIKIVRRREVVAEVNDSHKEISLAGAKKYDPEIALGDFLEEKLPPIDIGRVAAQAAKQVIVQKVREAERERQYEEYKDKQGEIINGVVKRVEFGNVVIDLGRGGEAFMRRENLIRGETFKVNDRVRAYIEEVRQDTKGSQIILSRVHDQFLAKLFAQEIPEVYDKVIVIKDVARDPGSKSKISVYAADSSIDPVGACVGVRGSRIQSIVSELQGEKIDIVKWSSDPAKYVINSLTPAKASKVIIDEELGRIEVVIPNDQLSIAIGRKGQNVRLASKLTGWYIDVMTEDEESKRRVEEFTTTTRLFMDDLGLEEVLAQLLAAEGFATIEDVAYVPLNELAGIGGIDEDLAKELIFRAKKIVDTKNEKFFKELEALGVEKVLVGILTKFISVDKVIVLANAGVKKFEDATDLTVAEFKQILPGSGLTDEKIGQLLEYLQTGAEHFEE